VSAANCSAVAIARAFQGQGRRGPPEGGASKSFEELHADAKGAHPLAGDAAKKGALPGCDQNLGAPLATPVADNIGKSEAEDPNADLLAAEKALNIDSLSPPKKQWRSAKAKESRRRLAKQRRLAKRLAKQRRLAKRRRLAKQRRLAKRLAKLPSVQTLQ